MATPQTLVDLIDRYGRLMHDAGVVRAEIQRALGGADVPAGLQPTPVPKPRAAAPPARPAGGTGSKRPAKVSDAALAALASFPQLAMVPTLDIFHKAQPPGEHWNYESFKAVLARLAEAGHVERVRHGIYRMPVNHGRVQEETHGGEVTAGS